MGGPGHPPHRRRDGAPDSLIGITYDAGALIAAERGEHRMWARHKAFVLCREVPVVPAPFVAPRWRGNSF